MRSGISQLDIRRKPDTAERLKGSILLVLSVRAQAFSSKTRWHLPACRHGFRRESDMRKHVLRWIGALAIFLAATFTLPQRAVADDDDPPTQVDRLSRGGSSYSATG